MRPYPCGMLQVYSSMPTYLLTLPICTEYPGVCIRPSSSGRGPGAWTQRHNGRGTLAPSHFLKHMAPSHDQILKDDEKRNNDYFHVSARVCRTFSDPFLHFCLILGKRGVSEDEAFFEFIFGFSTPKCLYYQLERSRGLKYGEHMTMCFLNL